MRDQPSTLVEASFRAHPPLAHIRAVAERLEMCAEDNSSIGAAEARPLAWQLRHALEVLGKAQDPSPQEPRGGSTGSDAP